MASNAAASAHGSPLSPGSPATPGSPARASPRRRAKRPKPHPMRHKMLMEKREKQRKQGKRQDPMDSPGAESGSSKSPERKKGQGITSSPVGTPGLSKSANARRTRSNLVPVLVTILTAGLFFACLSIVIGWISHSPRVGVCSKPACIMHANELKSAMNTAVKPCANFYSFVCGSWKPTGKRSVIERIYANSRDIAIRELEGDPRDVPVPLAPRYFQSCMANRSEDLLKSEIEKFKSFKKGLGLKWPEEWPETGQLVQAPLKILLNLTVNWNINLLIKVRAMPPYRNRHKSVYISRGDWYRSLDRTDEQFTAIVKEHCDYLGVPPPDDLLELKAHLQAITSETLTFTSDAREEQKRTLRDINQNTVSRRDRWLQYLNEIFRPQFTWNPDDVVLIQHPGILTRLNRLLEKMPEGSFRMALSWVFIRMYMWIVIGKPELRVKGDANVLQTFRKQTCLSHVESTFGLVASASHIYERFTRKMRENLADVFDMLREHIKISFTSTSWIDDLVKKKSHEKLDGMWERVLPDNRFFSNYSLASLYRNFPEVGDSFMDNVVNIAKEFRKTLARDDYVSIFSKRLGSGRVKSRYSYYYNSVSMDVGALEPPMLYADGTLAMIYGSLGTSLAASMVRSFDQRGILFNDKGEESPWWTAGHEEYDKRIKCDLGGAADGHSPPDASPSGTFTNPLSSLVPALSATYLAYRKAIKNEGLVDVFALQGLDTYSDDQVFFMTYCLMTCATDTNGDECNVPLRHLRKFATVFGCSTGDGMNPSEKCTFFD